MSHTMNPEAQEMGHLIREGIESEVLSGLADDYLNRILGYHHTTSQWVDLDHEDSPTAKDGTWYLDTEGDLYLEAEAGRLYHSTLDQQAIRRITKA